MSDVGTERSGRYSFTRCAVTVSRYVLTRYRAFNKYLFDKRVRSVRKRVACLRFCGSLAKDDAWPSASVPTCWELPFGGNTGRNSAASGVVCRWYRKTRGPLMWWPIQCPVRRRESHLFEGQRPGGGHTGACRSPLMRLSWPACSEDQRPLGAYPSTRFRFWLKLKPLF